MGFLAKVYVDKMAKVPSGTKEAKMKKKWHWKLDNFWMIIFLLIIVASLLFLGHLFGMIG